MPAGASIFAKETHFVRILFICWSLANNTNNNIYHTCHSCAVSFSVSVSAFALLCCNFFYFLFFGEFLKFKLHLLFYFTLILKEFCLLVRFFCAKCHIVACHCCCFVLSSPVVREVYKSLFKCLFI